MLKFTITLTDVEEAALKHVMDDPAWWTQNAISERARLAIIEIVERETARMIADPDIESIPASTDEIVLNAELPEAYEPVSPPVD